MVINSNFLLQILREKNLHKNRTKSGSIICPRCKVRTKLYKLSDGRRKCKKCGKKFVVKRKQERKEQKKYADIITCFCLDFSALKTAKLFNYRYSEVLEIYYKIRRVLIEESKGGDDLQGIVEADESYFGGVNRKRNKKYRKKYVCRGRGTDKVPVFGIREREGKVFIEPLQNLSEEYIESIIGRKVVWGSTIMTDEFTSYKGLIYKGYIHRFVEHKKDEYRRGDVHVNGMENFWSWAKEHLMKYHGVFRENLVFYLKEIEWKFNNRDQSIEEKAREIVKLLKKRCS